MPRCYRFAEFTVSPSRRTLTRAGCEVPLIPRYFDLLVLLIDRRREAVHRQEILDAVWSDVVVSDGALSQAVRTLRRALGDVAREPLFIRTVSRHGYRFVHGGVVEEPDGDQAGSPPAAVPPEAESAPDRFEPLLRQLLDDTPSGDDGGESSRREAAEALHALDTGEALARLDRRPGHEAARAVLRDARWDVPGSGEVPLLGLPGSTRAIAALVRLRLRRAARLAGLRWGSAAAGGAMAGALTGLFGHDLPALGGGLEGMAIGAAAGLGYAVSTPRPRGGGMATPHGLSRAGAALSAGACCAAAGSIVCLAGGHLVGTSLNLLAHAF